MTSAILEMVRTTEKAAQLAEANIPISKGVVVEMKPRIPGGLARMQGGFIALLIPNSADFLKLNMTKGGKNIYALADIDNIKDVFGIYTDPETGKHYKVPVRRAKVHVSLDWPEHQLVVMEDAPTRGSNVLVMPAPLTQLALPAPAPAVLHTVEEPTDDELEPHTISEAELQPA